MTSSPRSALRSTVWRATAQRYRREHATPVAAGRRQATHHAPRSTATPAPTTTSGCATRTRPRSRRTSRPRTPTPQERTAHLAELRTSIFEEVKARTLETDLSVPTRNRGHWYYGALLRGQGVRRDLPRPGRATPTTGPPRSAAEDTAPDQPALPGEEVLLDLNDLAEGHEFFSLGGSALTLDDALLAYAVDTVGDERYTIRFKDLATGELRDDELTGVMGGVAWHPNGLDCFYSTSRRVLARPTRCGATASAPPRTRTSWSSHEPDGRFWTGIGRTRSNRFLMTATGSKTTTEYRYLDTADPDADWVLFSERREDLEYPRARGPRRRGRLPGPPQPHRAGLRDRGRPDRAHGPAGWRALVPHDPAVRLEGVDAHAGHLVIHQRSDGLTQLRILELGADGTGEDYLVEFDHAVYTVGAAGNPVFHQPTVRLGYTTMAVPSSVYDYDVRTRELTLLRRAPVLGGYDPADYEEHRLWATAEDGERVPISIVAVAAHARGGRRHPAGPDPALRLRRLRGLDRPVLLRRPPLPPRPRGGLRHRPRPRRRRDGPALVRRRQAVRQAAHLRRLRGLRAPPRRHRLGDPRDAGRRGRQRRRPARGRRRQPGARAVRRRSSPRSRSSTRSPPCSTRPCR